MSSVPLQTGTDTQAYLDALAQIASSVSIVAVRHQGAVHAVTISSLVSVSLHPALLLFTLKRGSSMLARIEEVGELGITVLSASQADIARQLAQPNRPPVDSALLVPAADDTPFITNGAVHLAVRVRSISTAGDHALILGNVQVAHGSPNAPLLYQGRRYQRLEHPESCAFGI